MRIFTFLSTTLTFLAGLGFCSSALAADPSAEEEARKQFDAGVELFEAGEFEGASVAFARAYELRPSYKILYLVGKCENEQRHFALSLDAYSRYLVEAKDQIDAERRAEVEAEIDRLGALVGTIEVDCSVEGATVYVDDERRGETPLPSPLFVDLGMRTVVVKKGGEQLHREVVTIAGGQALTIQVEVDTAHRTRRMQRTTSRPLCRPRPVTGQPSVPGRCSSAVSRRSPWESERGVVGGVFAAKRSTAEDDMEAAQFGPEEDYNDAKDREKTAKGVSIAGFVGAGVFAAAGAVLLVLYSPLR